jgi:hypothetical protein
MSKIQKLFLGCLLLLPATGVTETLLIDAVKLEQLKNIHQPQRGASKATVTQQFGTPIRTHGAVGDPPITRWDYAQFAVYFEYDHVITTVIKYRSATSDKAE